MHLYRLYEISIVGMMDYHNGRMREINANNSVLLEKYKYINTNLKYFTNE